MNLLVVDHSILVKFEFFLILQNVEICMRTVDSVESGEVRVIVTGTQHGCGLTVETHVVYVLTHLQVGSQSLWL